MHFSCETHLGFTSFWIIDFDGHSEKCKNFNENLPERPFSGQIFCFQEL